MNSLELNDSKLQEPIIYICKIASLCACTQQNIMIVLLNICLNMKEKHLYMDTILPYGILVVGGLRKSNKIQNMNDTIKKHLEKRHNISVATSK